MTAPNAPGGLKLTHAERLHAFAKWVMMEGCWNGSDLDGGQLQEKALELDLLLKEPYDPKTHGESEFDIEPGDDWYRLEPLRAERDAKDAEIARLKEENDNLCEERANLRSKVERSAGYAAHWQREKQTILDREKSFSDRATRAEALLAAMVTVTEADINGAALAFARDMHGREVLEARPSYVASMRAALEAFVANKTAGVK